MNTHLLINRHGMCAKLMDYGATLISLTIPDKSQEVNLVLGFDTLEEYRRHPFYFGCTIGRVANRIPNGKFILNNETYQLALNDRHHLHGGMQGFDKVIWQPEPWQQGEQSGVTFSYLSKDGEEGYPGNLQVKTTYILTDQNELKILFWAKTDKATPIDLTNHTYWNLAGAGSGSILDHEMQVFADHYVVTDKEHIPTGEIRETKNSPFDFQCLTALNTRIKEAGGYDLCFVLNNSAKSTKPILAARIIEPNGKRILETWTTQPGLQFYTGNYLYDYPIAAGKRIDQYGGFCFETQNWPNAVNNPRFPSAILQPHAIYQHETIYKLSW